MRQFQSRSQTGLVSNKDWANTAAGNDTFQSRSQTGLVSNQGETLRVSLRKRFQSRSQTGLVSNPPKRCFTRHPNAGFQSRSQTGLVSNVLIRRLWRAKLCCFNPVLKPV